MSDGFARREHRRRKTVIGLILCACALAELAFKSGLLVGDQRRQPIFVGEAQPATGRLEALRGRTLVEILVIHVIIGSAVEHAHRADMDGPGVRIIGDARAVDVTIGLHPHHACAAVRDLLLRGDHVILIDRQADFESLARTIVPPQGHRAGRRQLLGIGGPDGVRVRGLKSLALPSEPGKKGVLRARRAIEPYRRRIFRNRFAIGGQHDIVDTRALQIDGAGQLRCADRDTGAILQNLRAIANRGRTARYRA